MTPTDEQDEIVSQVENYSDNLQINALAGTGKSTTLKMIDETFHEPCLYLAFNRAIVDEAEKERKKYYDTLEGTCFRDLTTIKTFNGLGHGVWNRTVASVVLNKKKITELLKVQVNALKGEDRRAASDDFIEICSAVNLARSLGYVPEGKYPHAQRLISKESLFARLDEKPSSLVAELIDAVLVESIKTAYKGNIDYNDQIYMPALFGGSFPRFPIVLVDEAQDLSPTNLAMLGKLVKNGTWLCTVGDPKQSIYGFRGAETNGMLKIREQFNMLEKDLTVTFRCPKAVVEAVHWHVPKYKWRKPGGVYDTLSDLRIDDIPEEATFICRNNAPLFRLAFKLLAERRMVSVAGSEIGPRVVRMLQKIGVDGDTREDLILKIEGWRDEKLQAANNLASINDMADCMLVFASYGENYAQAIAYAEYLFEQRGSIYLTTGHKAKGREWNVVYHLDPWLIGDADQERNLRYVITTRAQDTCFEINSTGIH